MQPIGRPEVLMREQSLTNDRNLYTPADFSLLRRLVYVLKVVVLLPVAEREQSREAGRWIDQLPGLLDFMVRAEA